MPYDYYLNLVVIPVLGSLAFILVYALFISKRCLPKKTTDLEKYTQLLKGFGFSELERTPNDNILIEKLPPNKYHRGCYYHGWESIVLSSGIPNDSHAWMHFDRWGKFVAYGARA